MSQWITAWSCHPVTLLHRFKVTTCINLQLIVLTWVFDIYSLHPQPPSSSVQQISTLIIHAKSACVNKCAPSTVSPTYPFEQHLAIVVSVLNSQRQNKSAALKGPEQEASDAPSKQVHGSSKHATRRWMRDKVLCLPALSSGKLFVSSLCFIRMCSLDKRRELYTILVGYTSVFSRLAFWGIFYLEVNCKIWIDFASTSHSQHRSKLSKILMR